VRVAEDSRVCRGIDLQIDVLLGRQRTRCCGGIVEELVDPKLGWRCTTCSRSPSSSRARVVLIS